jgi:hypothetical protein
MNIQQVKDQTNRAAMDAMNNGEYVTIISYVCVPRGTDYIGGQTFKNGHLQSCWLGDHYVK